MLKKQQSAGFNLLELMMAMALSTLLALVLITLFFSVKRVERLHHELVGMLDNGRYAVYLLRKEWGKKTYQFSIWKRSLYKKKGEGRRQLVAYHIYQLESHKKSITFWIESSDQKIKRKWTFSI